MKASGIWVLGVRSAVSILCILSWLAVIMQKKKKIIKSITLALLKTLHKAKCLIIRNTFKPIICIWQADISFGILFMVLVFSARIFHRHAVLRSFLSWETSRKKCVLLDRVFFQF